MSLQIDYSPLHQRITYTETLRSMHTKEKIGSQFGTIGLVAAICLISYGLGAAGIFEAGKIFSVVVVIMAIAAYIATVYDTRRRNQILKFTKANNLRLIERVKPSGQNGMIFNIGHSKNIERAIATKDGQPFKEIANYTYDTGHGKNRRTHDFGFMRIPLPRHLPNMVLDAKSNNFLKVVSTLPVGLSKDQTLSLEGDFDKYFTLYAPKEYKTDALYVFTPDIMAIMIDHLRDYDVEIVDNMMYLYSNKKFSLTDPKRLEQLIKISINIYDKLQRRTDYYADSRVGDRAADTVADAGRRLKNGTPTWMIVAFLVAVGLIALIMFG